MKSALPWIVVLLLCGGIYFVHSASKEKDVELARLRQESTELDRLRAENEELHKFAGQADEMARLRKDNADLLRLRSENKQLRDQNVKMGGQIAAAQARSSQTQEQLTKLASENQGLQQQAQQLQTDQKNNALAGTNDQQVRICIGYLSQLASAKQQWGMEFKKTSDAVPAPADLQPYFHGQILPICPMGGTYTLNNLQTPPTCSIPGHALGQ